MLRTILFTTFLAIVFFLGRVASFDRYLHVSWPAMLLFFLSLSFLMQRLVALGNQRGSQGFVQFYLIFTVARLLLSALFVGFYLYRGVVNRNIFVVDFLVLYMIYTSFEIYGLSRNLRRDS